MPGAPPVVVTWADPGALRAMEADIQSLRHGVDILIVSIHWGLSGSSQVIDYQREVGHAAIRAGADLVLGHHPHRPQGIEILKGRPIFYSTGNFAFDWAKMRGRNLDGILIKCRIRDRVLDKVSFVPVQRNQDNLVAPLAPTLDPGQAIVDQIRELSAAFGTRLSINGQEAIVQAEGQRC
jgi:poly-gamma-glutamate synthesis protein (capsule biosynthesis protein)